MTNEKRRPASELPLQMVWRHLERHYEDDRECLASYLALEAAEVLEGVKPGNLVTLSGRPQPCGRSILDLWRSHGRDLIAGSGLAAEELAEQAGSLLLYLYRPEEVQRLLARTSVRVILEKAGYSGPVGPGELFARLREKMAGGRFPHEIGIILGYPLKDVVAFMGWVTLPFVCQGPWKIYGDPRPSLELALRFRECRCRMAGRLAAGSPLDCLAKAA